MDLVYSLSSSHLEFVASGEGGDPSVVTSRYSWSVDLGCHEFCIVSFGIACSRKLYTEAPHGGYPSSLLLQFHC
jgi:hypothetical protein